MAILYIVLKILTMMLFYRSPWGGFAYKSQDKIRLTLGNMN